MLNIIKGDLIKLAEEGKFDYIVHGCNCHHTMGSGIAKQLKEKYPGVFEADKRTNHGDMYKLGGFSYFNTGKFIVVNAYTQYSWYPKNIDICAFNYEAFRGFLAKFKTFLKENYIDIGICGVGFPKIGAGLAGGDWNIILKMIQEFADNMEEFADVTIVEYEGG